MHSGISRTICCCIGAVVSTFFALGAWSADLSGSYYGQPVPDLNSAIGSPATDIFETIHRAYERLAPTLIQDESPVQRELTPEEQDYADLHDGLAPPEYYERNAPSDRNEGWEPGMPLQLPDKLPTETQPNSGETPSEPSEDVPRDVGEENGNRTDPGNSERPDPGDDRSGGPDDGRGGD